ncbi:MAG TPA: SDR family NAD(P)-dependent oxidoreductase [Pseudonocardiaceae bacterium]|nr:SDR family NAD(P)-dependent oxidoreductase [Pseudonocardiaceae bacterium]
MSKTLDGRVAVVTGASRGIGKGIALELGAAGATVYLTGRTKTPGLLPGTIDATAAEVDALGGHGIAIACDHHDDAQVEALFARVRDEQGRLDVLVNNVFSTPDLAPWLHKPFWELPIGVWDELIDIGLRSHYVAGVHAVSLLREGGVITNISNDVAGHTYNVPYDVGKAGLNKLTEIMAADLRPRGIAAVTVWPGLVCTELLMLAARTTDEGIQVLDIPGQGPFDLSAAESPRFVGRAVAGLAADPDALSLSGRALLTQELAERYGVTDLDGSTPNVRANLA